MLNRPAPPEIRSNRSRGNIEVPEAITARQKRANQVEFEDPELEDQDSETESEYDSFEAALQKEQEIQSQKQRITVCVSSSFHVLIISYLTKFPTILRSPDKHPDNPAAVARFKRLGVINKILQDERRDRYDHFLT